VKFIFQEFFESLITKTIDEK